MELWLGIIASALAIVMLILQRSTKTKLDKAREIVMKSRAATARDQYSNQTRSNEELEKSLDALHGDLSAILRGKKADPQP